jgi:hypothetical protein
LAKLTKRLNIIGGCNKAVEIVARAQEMEQLYRKAKRDIGEGELRNGILNLAVEAFADEDIKREVFSSDESMLSFFCGIWIQFLLTEIAGIKKDKLQSLAKKVFQEIHEKQSVH